VSTEDFGGMFINSFKRSSGEKVISLRKWPLPGSVEGIGGFKEWLIYSGLE
jgi:hypothetical protein